MRGKILSVAAVILALAPGGPARAQLEGHAERPDDPPAAVTAVRTAAPASSLMGGIQVNVGPGGANIVGDAANEPSIAVDPNHPNRLAIGFRYFETVASNFRQAGWAWSDDGGRTWTFPGTLEPAFRSDPVLDADSAGNFYYYSLDGELCCQVFVSPDQGRTWSGPFGDFGGDKAWMAVDRTGGSGDGNLYALWVSPGCSGQEQFSRSSDGGLTFSAPVSVPSSPRWGTVTVGPGGEVFCVGLPGGTDTVIVARSANAQNGGTPVFELVREVPIGGVLAAGQEPNPGGLIGQVWAATDHSGGPFHGAVYVLASVNPPGDDPLDVHVVRSLDGGDTWSEPVRVNDDSDPDAWQWFGTMSVAPDGRLDAVWNDNRSAPAPSLSRLYHASSDDGGATWSSNLSMSPAWNSHLGWPNQNKIGDYYHMVSDLLGAHLAWAATFNGEQDVYYLRIGAYDCNGNGVADTEDVGSGFSADCNDNGIPDECESDADCNGSGTADICEIADGSSLDCNDNGVPDECESDADCDGSGTADICEIADGSSPDCNGNGVPDACDVDGGTSLDCDGNGVPDECDPLLAPAVSWIAGASPRAAILADMDGDDDLDAVVANQLVDHVSIMFNDGGGELSLPVPYPTGDDPYAIVARDLNGDGAPDLAIANRLAASVSVLLNLGDGTLGPATIYPAGAGPWSITACDLDGDDDADLAVANFSAGTVSVLVNLGDGTFAPQVVYPTDGPFGITHGDLDGDDDVDLAMACFTTDRVAVLLNQGNGTFGAAVTWEANSAPNAVAAGDMNGDGHLDLVVTNLIIDYVTVLINDGNGGFALSDSHGVGNGPQALALSDLDGDGDLDVIAPNDGEARIGVLRNDGRGGLTLQGFHAVAASPQSVAAGDLDGDGAPDLAVSNFTGQSVSVLLNVAPACSCSGDMTGDGLVNVDDLIGVVLAWGSGSGPADLNGDGLVNVDDLILVVLGWGPCA